MVRSGPQNLWGPPDFSGGTIYHVKWTKALDLKISNQIDKAMKSYIKFQILL